MINFITSNAKKASDFKSFGFGVQEFKEEVPEIKSPSVEEVALYKAKDTKLDNIVVEDTSLNVDGSHFWGTDIKHVIEEIQDNPQYDGHSANWRVCLCMKKGDAFYLAIGELTGVLKYPKTEEGYHFEKFFAVEKNGVMTHYALLDKKEQSNLSPRFQALRKLEQALKTEDYTQLIRFPVTEVKDWLGEYQEEKIKNKLKP